MGSVCIGRGVCPNLKCKLRDERKEITQFLQAVEFRRHLGNTLVENPHFRPLRRHKAEAEGRR